MNGGIAILTGLLVVVTAYYAWQTRQTVKIMEQQPRPGNRPLLLFSLRDAQWAIVNIGKGPALNGRYETSHRKLSHVRISRKQGGEPRSSGPIAAVGGGEAPCSAHLRGSGRPAILDAVLPKVGMVNRCRSVSVWRLRLPLQA